MRFSRRFHCFRSEVGEIAPIRCWVLLDYDGYMYTADTFLGLVFILLTEWRDDKHLAGY